MPPFVNCIAAASNHAYVGQETTLHVFDLQDPAHPVAVGSQALNGTITDMEIAENALFVAHLDGGVSVFDISNPTHPVRITGYNTPGFAVSVRVLGNYVVVADGPSGLLILEAQPLQRPELTIGCIETNALIQWPASALGFVLEFNPDLLSANWTVVPKAPQFTGDVFSVSVPMLPNQFFRLRGVTLN
jgi:hypothetical protein